MWKALSVRNVEDVRWGLDRYEGTVDGLVMDGWHPDLLGGTGEAFPWDEVASLREAFPTGMAFVAAGGLRPDNVEEAIQKLGPDAVDVSSGVEIGPGIKDRKLVESFIENARNTGRGTVR